MLRTTKSSGTYIKVVRHKETKEIKGVFEDHNQGLDRVMELLGNDYEIVEYNLNYSKELIMDTQKKYIEEELEWARKIDQTILPLNTIGAKVSIERDKLLMSIATDICGYGYEWKLKSIDVYRSENGLDIYKVLHNDFKRRIGFFDENGLNLEKYIEKITIKKLVNALVREYIKNKESE
jgi:hypothetical protein